MATITLTDEKRFSIADTVAKTFSIDYKAITPNTRKFYFREVINSQIKVNGQVTTLTEAFGVDEATNLTGIILNRLAMAPLRRVNAGMNVEA